jgi:hypothetical protein
MRYAGARWAVVGAAAAIGCGKTEPSSPYEPANLEQAEIVFGEEFEEERYDLTGTISAEGSGRDWTVSVGPRSLTVHSSGASDLSVMGDLLDGRASLARDSYTEELSVELLDAEGNLHYLLEAVEPGPLTFENFGSGFVAPANDLGTAQAGNFEVTFTSRRRSRSTAPPGAPCCCRPSPPSSRSRGRSSATARTRGSPSSCCVWMLLARISPRSRERRAALCP